MGDIPNALIWIRKGIERNAASHEGTEWLHAAILEAKLALQAEPDWLERHSVLDACADKTREQRERALEFQLNERLYFIQGNDPIMCDLMYQAALIATDPAKKAYFLRQVPRFGSIRDGGLRKIAAARH